MTLFHTPDDFAKLIDLRLEQQGLRLTKLQLAAIKAVLQNQAVELAQAHKARRERMVKKLRRMRIDGLKDGPDVAQFTGGAAFALGQCIAQAIAIVDDDRTNDEET